MPFRGDLRPECADGLGRTINDDKRPLAPSESVTDYAFRYRKGLAMGQCGGSGDHAENQYAFHVEEESRS